MWNQPSSSLASAVASGLPQYSRNTFGPRISTSPSSATLISTPGIGWPTVPTLWASSRLTVPTPLVSVSP